MTAIILFAHGSTVESANAAVRAVTGELTRRVHVDLTATAFLDCGRPTLGESIEAVAQRGATRVIVVPYFLTLGIHLQRDLPQLIQEVSARHAGLQIDVTDPLDGHAKLVEIVEDRVRSALDGGSGNSSQTR